MIENLHVIVPGPYGVDVCPVDQLIENVGAIEEPDDEAFAAAVDNSSIDFESSPDRWPALAAAVRALNLTGDADAYWRAR